MEKFYCCCLVTKSCPILGAMDCSLPGSSVHKIFPGMNTGVGCLFLLQRIFPTLGSNPGLLHCRQLLYCLSHQESPSQTVEIIVIRLEGEVEAFSGSLFIELRMAYWRLRVRWLDSISDSVDMNLSKLWEIVEGRGAWFTIVHGGGVGGHKRDMT